jgi:hypothetical protein
MADRILDRDKHPQWQGERTKMVYAFPSNEDLWQQYAVLRAEGLKAERGIVDATEFYRTNRVAMDEGALIAWPERFNEDELSAVQHAMNLKLQDANAFYAEYQNEPPVEAMLGADQLSAEEIAGKINRLPRCIVAQNCTHVTAFIDVQATLLYYVVAAWSDDFTGGVIDYGAYPDQRRPYFALREAHTAIALPRCWPRRDDLRRADGADHRPPRSRMEEGGRGRAADRALPRRCQLGNIDRRGLSVLPAERVRQRADAEPRALRRRFEPAL